MSYNEGDLIEAVKGDTVIRARLQRDPAGYKNPLAVFTVALRADVRHLEANGYTVTVLEKAAPPVPTEPGWYADKDGEPWYIRGGASLLPRYAPYTRLEPVPVTVQKVIDYMVARNGWSEVGKGGMADELIKYFGVTS
jgi:hypothetical protein